MLSKLQYYENITGFDPYWDWEGNGTSITKIEENDEYFSIAIRIDIKNKPGWVYLSLINDCLGYHSSLSYTYYENVVEKVDASSFEDWYKKAYFTTKFFYPMVSRFGSPTALPKLRTIKYLLGEIKEKISKEDKEKCLSLIDQLDDPDFIIREKAKNELLKEENYIYLDEILEGIQLSTQQRLTIEGMNHEYDFVIIKDIIDSMNQASTEKIED